MSYKSDGAAAVGDGDADGDVDELGDTLALGDVELDGLNDVEALGEIDALGDNDVEADGEIELDGEIDVELLGLKDGEADALALTLGDNDALADTVEPGYVVNAIKVPSNLVAVTWDGNEPSDASAAHVYKIVRMLPVLRAVSTMVPAIAYNFLPVEITDYVVRDSSMLGCGKIGTKPDGVHSFATPRRRGFGTGATICRERPMMAATRPSIFSALRTLSGM